MECARAVGREAWRVIGSAHAQPGRPRGLSSAVVSKQ